MHATIVEIDSQLNVHCFNSSPPPSRRAFLIAKTASRCLILLLFPCQRRSGGRGGRSRCIVFNIVDTSFMKLLEEEPSLDVIAFRSQGRGHEFSSATRTACSVLGSSIFTCAMSLGSSIRHASHPSGCGWDVPHDMLLAARASCHTTHPATGLGFRVSGFLVSVAQTASNMFRV